MVAPIPTPQGGGYLQGLVRYVRKTKVEKVMGEYKRGTLHSGSKKGPAVKSRKQAVAIALSEQRRAKRSR